MWSVVEFIRYSAFYCVYNLNNTKLFCDLLAIFLFKYLLLYYININHKNKFLINILNNVYFRRDIKYNN